MDDDDDDDDDDDNFHKRQQACVDKAITLQTFLNSSVGL